MKNQELDQAAHQILGLPRPQARLTLNGYLNRVRKVPRGGVAYERILSENAHLCTRIRELAETTGRASPWSP